MGYRVAKAASCRERGGRVFPLCPRVLAPAEIAVLLVVARGVARRLDGADLGVSAFDAVMGADLVDPGLDLREFRRVDPQEFEIAQPRERGNVRDRVFAAGDEGVLAQPSFVEIIELEQRGAVTAL